MAIDEQLVKLIEVLEDVRGDAAPEHAPFRGKRMASFQQGVSR
jgi:hypothetical protein